MRRAAALHASPRVVVTGGPHAGKTTLLQSLAAAGYRTVPEAALLVIEELNARLGVDGQIAWRRDNQATFQERVSETQLRLEAEVDAGDGAPVFFDRGILDGWAYCASRALAPPAALVDAEKRGRYAQVFVLATVTPYAARAETGRMSDEDASRRMGRLLFDTYAEFGYDPVWVPQDALDLRRRLVLDRSSGGR